MFSRKARRILTNKSTAKYLSTQPQSFWAIPGAVPSLNSEQATACFETVSTYLELSRANEMLKEIRLSQSKQSLATRWQRMFDIYLTTQLHVIHPYGYAADQNGLQQFNMNVAQVMQSAGSESEQGIELLEAQKENWDLLLDRAFGVVADDSNVIDLETCRNIAVNVSSKIRSDDFSSQIEMKVGQESDPALKQAALMELVVDVHLEIMPTFGLEGEEGYVRVQSSMMRYSGDQQIMQNMQQAMMHVQQKAGDFTTQ
tara:strand:- start:1538 stop:2308 length:771 start_codon:yes stop_codon:yes gene_type:complete